MFFYTFIWKLKINYLYLCKFYTNREDMNGDKKMLRAIDATTIKELLNRANNLSLTKENIVRIIDQGDQYILIFYK